MYFGPLCMLVDWLWALKKLKKRTNLHLISNSIEPHFERRQTFNWMVYDIVRLWVYSPHSKRSLTFIHRCSAWNSNNNTNNTSTVCESGEAKDIVDIFFFYFVKINKQNVFLKNNPNDLKRNSSEVWRALRNSRYYIKRRKKEREPIHNNAVSPGAEWKWMRYSLSVANLGNAKRFNHLVLR